MNQKHRWLNAAVLFTANSGRKQPVCIVGRGKSAHRIALNRIALIRDPAVTIRPRQLARFRSGPAPERVGGEAALARN